MDFLLWTCLVLGLFGAISLALSGLGLHHGHSHLPGDHAPGHHLGGQHVGGHHVGGHHVGGHHLGEHQMPGHHVPGHQMPGHQVGGDHADIGDTGEHHGPTGHLAGQHHGPMPALSHLAHSDHLPAIAHAAERLAAAHHSQAGISPAMLAGRVQSTDLTHLSEALNRVKSGVGDGFDEPAPTMSPFSSFSIFGFLATFGLVGLAMRYSNPAFSQSLILSVAGVSGIAIGWMLWKVLDRFLKFVEHASTLTDRDIIGALAEATMPIGINSIGEVRIAAAGRHLTGPARNTTAAPLQRQEKVRIAGREGELYMLEALTVGDLEFLAALSALDATLAGKPPPPVQVLRPPAVNQEEPQSVAEDLTT